jgi:hypothetical protein
MEIGKPKRIYTVEPIESPVPAQKPEKVLDPSPAGPAPVSPEQVPTRV